MLTCYLLNYISMITLVIDGNFLFHSEYSIFTGWSKKDGFKTKRDEIVFLQGVANKLFHAINQFPKGGKVIFCVDSKSWRKAVEIPGGMYKGNREQADGGKGQMDKETKEKFYSLMEEFGKLLENIGIICSRVPGAEGDDLLFKWANYFYMDGQCSVIISGDRDMTQNVKIGETDEPWIVTWNNNSKHNRIYTPEGWRAKWLKNESSADIFSFQMGGEKEQMLKMIRDGQINIEHVHPPYIILKKILEGDDGDDVPSAWNIPYVDKKGQNKIKRITDGVGEKIIANIREKYNLTDVNLLDKWGEYEFMDYLSGLILRMLKDVDGKAEREKVYEALERNARLMWLSDSMLPENLLINIEQHIQEKLKLETKRNLWNRKSLFAGTRFDEKVAPKEADPFLGMNLENLI